MHEGLASIRHVSLLRFQRLVSRVSTLPHPGSRFDGTDATYPRHSGQSRNFKSGTSRRIPAFASMTSVRFMFSLQKDRGKPLVLGDFGYHDRFLNEDAVHQAKRAVHAGGEIEIVGCHHCRDARLAYELQKLLEYPLGGRRIEIA